MPTRVGRSLDALRKARKVDMERGRFTPVVVAGALSLLLMGMFFAAPDGMNPVYGWICLAVFYGCFLVTVISPVEIRRGIKTYAKPELFFMVLYFLIYFLPYQQALTGNGALEESQFFTNTYAEESNRALVLATVGLVMFIGAVRCEFAPRNVIAPTSGSAPEAAPTARMLTMVVCLATAALLVLNRAMGLRASGEGVYTGTEHGGLLAEAVSLMLQILGMLAFALLVHSVANRQRITWSLRLACAMGLYWMVTILVLGNRNGFLLMAMVLVAGFLIYRFRSGRMLLLVLAVGAVTMYGTIGALRTEGQISASSVVHALTNGGDAESESTFNVSTVGLRAALAHVPDGEEYGYGRYKLIGFLGVVPLIRGYIIPDDVEFISTADLLSAVMTNPEAPWGVGTSIVSDIYIDFGPGGVPVLMALLGLAVAWARRLTQDRPRDYRATVFFLLLLASVSQIPRYALDMPVRAVVWSGLLMWLFNDRVRKTPREEVGRGR